MLLTPRLDIEDMLETIAFLNGKKWTSMLIKRTYFGNWLRDYSQAVDIGSLKGVNAETIRILVRTRARCAKQCPSSNLGRFGYCLSWLTAMPLRSSR
jgi:hypothetical protein